MTSQPAGPGVARPLGAAPSIGSRQLWWIGGVGITTALALLALFALARLPDLPMLNRAPTRTAPALAAGAQRLLSLNVTSDEIVLALAPDRVIGVSELALDPRSSNVVTEAAAVPLKVRGEIEQVLTAQPDVVVMGAHSADLARQVEEAGIRVVWIHGYQSIEWVRSVIRTIGVEMGLSERADRLVEQMDTRIEAVRRRVVSRQRPSVLAYSESGYVPGKDTTTDEVITLAGGDNIAARLGIAGWRKLSLEQVVIADPEVILLKEGAQWVSPGPARPSGLAEQHGDSDRPSDHVAVAPDGHQFPSHRHDGGRISP